MIDPTISSVSLDEIPETARVAWIRLRDELQVILRHDLVAMWAHGGTTFSAGPPRSADLDTYVIVDRRPDERRRGGSKRPRPRLLVSTAWIGIRGTSSPPMPGNRRARVTPIAKSGVTRPGRFIEHIGWPDATCTCRA